MEEKSQGNIQREILEELLQVNFNLFKQYRDCTCKGTKFSAHLII